ncbi:MAG: DUF1697 domain-containing protein [Candidatus Dormibacteria bacterium]
MTTQIALWRAVNVGGTAKVSMGELRQLLLELGMGNPRTLLQTGNVVFGSSETDGAALEGLLEAETTARWGLSTQVIVRPAKELSSVIAKNPFPESVRQDPSHVVVVFLKSPPGTDGVRALAAAPGPERVAAGDRHIYATYPDGIGRSKLTMTLIERRLGSRGTARNWNTVLKLAALAQS